jgi:hypothetical protein
VVPELAEGLTWVQVERGASRLEANPVLRCVKPIHEIAISIKESIMLKIRLNVIAFKVHPLRCCLVF